MERDVKNIYQKALKGEAMTVPGLQAFYEEPLNPNVTIDSVKEQPKEVAIKIMKILKGKGFLKV
jgi:adenylylsulfate kinase